MGNSEILELIFRAKDMASGAVSTLRGGMQDLTNTQKTYKTSLEGLSGPANQFKNIIMQLGAAVGVAGLAKSFIEVNSSAEKTKLMLTGLLGSAEKANTAFQWILDFSTKAPFSIDGLKNSFVKLQVAGLDPMTGSLQTLTDAIAAMGGGDEELKRAAIAMQQMAGKGVVSMEELRQQLGEAMPRAMQAMAEGMGMSMSKLSKEIEQGNVSATSGLNAMMGKLKEWYGGSGEKMMTSWSGLISNVKVAWEKFMLTLGSTGIFDKLKATIDGLLKKIDEMTANGQLAVWGERISTTVKALIDLFLRLAGIFVTVVDALGPFLPMIVQIIAYFKSFQLLLGVFVGLPMQVVKSLFALYDAFKLLQTTNIFSWFERLSYLIYMNIAAGTTLGLVMKASFIGIALALGYALGALINYVIETKKLNDLNKETAENVKYIKERYDNYRTSLTEVDAKLNEINKAYAAGAISSGEYAQKIHALNLEKLQLTKASAESASALTHFLNAIRNVDKEMIEAQKAYEAGTMSAADYQSKIVTLTQKKADLFAKAKDLKQGLQDIDGQMIALSVSFTKGEITEAAYTAQIDSLTAAKKQLIVQTDNLTGATAKQQKTYEDFISSLSKGSADWIAIEEKKIATVEANNSYEKALLDKSLAEKTISQADYYARITAMDAEAFERKKVLIQAQIDLEKGKGSEADFKKISELEEQKTQAVLKGTTDRVKLETDAIKETTKKHEDAFSQWKELKELELQSLKAKLDLANAMDEAAAQQGIITQSTLLANKLARTEEFYQAEISKAEETADKIAATEGIQSKAYADAIQEKAKLQAEWQVTAIQSAAAIAEAEKQELDDAQQRNAQTVGDNIKLAEMERDKKLKQNQQDYDQGLIDQQQFNDAKTKIVDDANKKINASNKEVVSQFTFHMKTMADSAMAAYEFVMAFAHMALYGAKVDHEALADAIKTTYQDTIATVNDAISGVTDAYTAIKNSGIDTLQDAFSRMSEIRSKMQGDWKDFYYYMKDLGKGIAASVGMTAEEWIRKLADYIAYVKGLMQSLKDLISSYQDQLDSLRGNDAAILDRWYAAEVQKLNDKYGEELRSTKEFQDAMLLLQQLYNEKKKKLEEEAAGKTDEATTAGAGSGSSGSGGSSGSAGGASLGVGPFPLSGVAQAMTNSLNATLGQMAQSLAASTDKFKQVLDDNGFLSKNGEMVLKKELNMGVTLEMKSDAPTAERYAKEVLMPILKRQFALEGITLK